MAVPPHPENRNSGKTFRLDHLLFICDCIPERGIWSCPAVAVPSCKCALLFFRKRKKKHPSWCVHAKNDRSRSNLSRNSRGTEREKKKHVRLRAETVFDAGVNLILLRILLYLL